MQLICRHTRIKVLTESPEHSSLKAPVMLTAKRGEAPKTWYLTFPILKGRNLTFIKLKRSEVMSGTAETLMVNVFLFMKAIWRKLTKAIQVAWDISNRGQQFMKQ